MKLAMEGGSDKSSGKDVKEERTDDGDRDSEEKPRNRNRNRRNRNNRNRNQKKRSGTDDSVDASEEQVIF